MGQKKMFLEVERSLCPAKGLFPYFKSVAVQVTGVQLLRVSQVCHHPLALGICSLGSGSWRCQGSITALHSLLCVGMVSRTWDFC